MKFPKNYILLILIILFTLFSCSTHSGLENETVKKAIEMQELIVNDPLYFKILRELEDEGSISWKEGSTTMILEDLSFFNNKIEWLVSNLKYKKPYNKDSVFMKFYFNPFSSTTAATVPNVHTTLLNKWNLDRDKYSILNTLMHEIIHSYGLIHPNNQYRIDNQCDAAYIAGDLAELLALHRDGLKERLEEKIKEVSICPALIEKFNKYRFKQ